MRPLAFLSLLFALAGCGSDRRSSSAEPGTSAARTGPDAVVLRAPRDGGRITAALYPALDSTVWRSQEPAPALDRALAFDAEGGSLAAVSDDGTPVRLDLRLGTVRRANPKPLASLASLDGVDIFGVQPDGAVTRLVPSGGEWSVRVRGTVQEIVPQRDGSVVVAAARGTTGLVWRFRPPSTRASDSLVVDAAGHVVDARTSERVYFANGAELAGVQTRALDALDDVTFDASVRALAATPSGDRFYASLEGEESLGVLDRYSNRVSGTVDLPGVASDLRIDPVGRYVIARAAQGDSAWLVAVSTNTVVGTIRSAWRGDLPLVLPDGAVLTAVGNDAVIVDGATMKVARTIAGGASEWWHVVQWNGFRPRAAGLDRPVRFESTAPPDSAAADTTVPPDTAAVDTTVPPPHDTTPSRPARPRIEIAEAATISSAGFTVQFAAANTERDARATLAKLRLPEKVAARIVPAVRDGRTLYRVVAGPFATRAQAERVGKASGHAYWLYAGAP